MKKVFRILLIVLLAGLFVGTFVFLWNKTRPVKTVYGIVTPVRDTISQFVVATGQVEPRDEVLIKPQISGIISALHKEAGNMVRQGDVIATVKVIPEMSSLNNAESGVKQAEINLEQTRREYERTEKLYRKNVITLDEFEKAETQLRIAEENLQSARDNLEIVRDGIVSRNAEISNTQIRSTIDGMILDIPVKVGNSVIQSNTFNDGTTIAVVADMNDMIFRGKVDETDVGKLHEGMPVTLTIGAVQDSKLNARLEYISPKATTDNNVIMFEVKAAVDVDDNIFVRSGYSANASIMIENRENVLAVPESVLEFEEDKTYAYVLTSPEGAEEQTFEKREVTTGLSDGMNMEIKEGLSETDRLRGMAMPRAKKSPTRNGKPHRHETQNDSYRLLHPDRPAAIRRKSRRTAAGDPRPVVLTDSPVCGRRNRPPGSRPVDAAGVYPVCSGKQHRDTAAGALHRRCRAGPKADPAQLHTVGKRIGRLRNFVRPRPRPDHL